jgi:hypothetical protein
MLHGEKDSFIFGIRITINYHLLNQYILIQDKTNDAMIKSWNYWKGYFSAVQDKLIRYYTFIDTKMKDQADQKDDGSSLARRMAKTII